MQIIVRTYSLYRRLTTRPNHSDECPFLSNAQNAKTIVVLPLPRSPMWSTDEEEVTVADRVSSVAEEYDDDRVLDAETPVHD